MQNFLLHINGKDGPGITATISEYLDEKNARIQDIEQTVVLDHLSLHFFIKIENSSADDLYTGLKKCLKNFSLHVRIRKVENEFELPDPANRIVTTIIANDVSPGFISKLTRTIANENLNIDSIRKLNNGGLETIEIILTSKKIIDIPKITEKLLLVACDYPDVDLAVQRENLYRRSKRLIVFDMDKTLIQQEVIDELAKEIGRGEEMAALTRDAMSGNIDFSNSIKMRAKLLKGITESDLEAVASRIKLTPGANTLIKVLKKLGFKIAIFSGGFTYFAERLKQELGLHYVCANNLEFLNGAATGNLDGIIVDAQRKADLLELLAQQEGILKEQVIAIGDGANDLLMLKKAGLGIAFNAKPITQSVADTRLNQKSLTSILYLMGITDNEIQAMGYKIYSLNSQRTLGS